VQIHQIAAIVAATILGMDAIIHVYWLTGRTWPAADTRTLSRVVLNADVPFTPRVLIPLVVILTAAATTVLVKGDILSSVTWVPSWVATTATIAVAGGAFVRAAAGVVWAMGIGADKGSMFFRLNVSAYTPICVVLAGATAIVAVRA
jgi:Protein of unknown function (DUF3995)